MNIGETYLLKALDYYPYELDEAIENLNYALSYDEENPIAHCLQGRIYAEQLEDYNQAIECYRVALGYDPYAIKVYKHYLDALILNDDWEDALQFINFALKVKGVDRGTLHRLRAIVYENMQNYTDALSSLKVAKRNGFNNCFIEGIAEDIARVKKKMPKKRKKKKKKDVE